MVSLILSGHGNFATGLQDAITMLWGDDESLNCIPYIDTDGNALLKEKFSKAIADCNGGEVLFLVDLYGGTPYNVAARLAHGNNTVDILAGINLPTVMEALSECQYNNLKDLVASLKASARESILVFSEQMAKKR